MNASDFAVVAKMALAVNMIEILLSCCTILSIKAAEHGVHYNTAVALLLLSLSVVTATILDSRAGEIISVCPQGPGHTLSIILSIIG